MPRQPKLPSIEIERTWTARHSHHNLRVAEAVDGRVWLRLDDLRQWVPGLLPGHVLAERHPGMVRVIPPSTDPYIEASAFQWITQKSTNVPTLKLRAWLESAIVAPARRRRDWDDYEPVPTGRITSSLLSAEISDRPAHQLLEGNTRRALERHIGESKGNGLLFLIDPRAWTITQGRWGLKTVMVAGVIGSALAMMLSGWVDSMAFDVNSRYLVWAWAAIALAAWAVLFNAAWVLGALRSGIRRSGDGFNPWWTILLVAANLAVAAFVFEATARNLQELARTWWAIYVVGDPPVVVSVDERHPDGSASRLLMRGPIGIGSTRALRDAIAKNPGVRELVLSSPGGLVVEGFGLADAVRTSDLKSIVVRDNCSSACTLPFIMGEERVVIRGATVGFHRSYSIFGDFGTRWGPTEHRMAELMRSRGVSESFIQRAFAVPGWSMYEAPAEVLLAEGVVTELR